MWIEDCAGDSYNIQNEQWPKNAQRQKRKQRGEKDIKPFKNVTHETHTQDVDPYMKIGKWEDYRLGTVSGGCNQV